MKFSVFIHKAESLSEDYRGGESTARVRRSTAVTVALSLFRPTSDLAGLLSDTNTENYAEIQRALTEELEDFHYPSLQEYAPNMDLSDPGVCNGIFSHMIGEVKFDMTSVHDVSLRDAWSKVIQGVMEMLPAVEALLLNFTEVSSVHWPRN